LPKVRYNLLMRNFDVRKLRVRFLDADDEGDVDGSN
jgi:hypothetical protein